MGEMIKFGIKMALTIATAVALVAALALLFVQLSSLNFGNSNFIKEIFALISLVFPINLAAIFALFTPLVAFKIAYWAADKMIQFLEAAG